MSNDVFLRPSIGGNDVELAPSQAEAVAEPPVTARGGGWGGSVLDHALLRRKEEDDLMLLVAMAVARIMAEEDMWET